MAAGRTDGETRKSHNSESQMDDDYEIQEEEPPFSDPEDFVDDVTDEGNRGLVYILNTKLWVFHYSDKFVGNF